MSGTAEELKVDLCVIGAGSGGLSVAAGAVQMGASVVLVEAGRMGGDCLNYGCVPSKALIASARAAQGRGMGAALGIAPAVAEIDAARVRDHIAQTIAQIAPHDSAERFEALGCRVIRDRARFIGPHTAQAGEISIRARRFVIATGSRPAIPAIPGLDAVPYMTNETLFDLAATPAHLLILGGGPIGIEMAQAHRRLGAEVTVIEAGTALGREDPEFAALVLDALREDGVTILENARAAAVSGSAGAITVTLENRRAVSGSHLLVATGRQGCLEALDLGAAGIETEDGRLRLDRRLRTTNRRVYAVGDAVGGLQYTHLAGYHAGLVLREAMFGLPVGARNDHIPRVTYCDPELAQIGLTEAEARQHYGARLSVVRVPFAQSDRARADARTGGLDQADGGARPPGWRRHRRGAGGRDDRPLGAGLCRQAAAVGDRCHRAALSDAGRDLETGGIGLFFPKTLC